MSPANPKRPSRLEALAPYSLGQKLKTLRAEKGLTLASLGAETRLSTALLSKLESERMVPTHQRLAKICRVYGVDLGFFFASPGQQSLAITRRAHIVADRRDQPMAKRIPLHCVTHNSRQVSAIVDVPAGATLDVSTTESRTELTAYVLEGTLHMTTAGVLDVLEPGDCIVLDTNGRVFWTAPDSRCRVLAVFAK